MEFSIIFQMRKLENFVDYNILSRFFHVIDLILIWKCSQIGGQLRKKLTRRFVHTQVFMFMNCC